jgi:hypothetical protein
MKKTLEFNEQELNIILFALQKQPFEMVNDLIRNVVGQLQAQQVAVEPKIESKEETKRQKKIEGRHRRKFCAGRPDENGEKSARAS